jgi:hypothetical protein
MFRFVLRILLFTVAFETLFIWVVYIIPNGLVKIRMIFEITVLTLSLIYLRTTEWNHVVAQPDIPSAESESRVVTLDFISAVRSCDAGFY